MMSRLFRSVCTIRSLECSDDCAVSIVNQALTVNASEKFVQ
jgi:hypothetical protein